MRLYELRAADEALRFSPFVWRARLALAHKGVEAERVALTFLDKAPLEPSGAKTVPVLEDDGIWVKDSWAIAEYLEDKFPERPSLFGDATGHALTRFFALWADRTILAGLFPMLAADICDTLDEANAAYFRKTREARLGRDLYEAREERESRLEPFRASLAPLRVVLEEQPFVCGEAPAHADYLAFSGFAWARGCSRFEPLAEDDPIHDWRERMLDLFGGLARKDKRAG